MELTIAPGSPVRRITPPLGTIWPIAQECCGGAAADAPATHDVATAQARTSLPTRFMRLSSSRAWNGPRSFKHRVFRIAIKKGNLSAVRAFHAIVWTSCHPSSALIFRGIDEHYD